MKSSTGVAVVMTNAGRAYVKAMGNDEGPHALARELVGTRLARWFGLPTLDDYVLSLEESDPLFKFKSGKRAQPGPAFITRAVQAHPWGGKGKTLRRLLNPEDITRLVVVDTWLLNNDRHSRMPPAPNPPPHPAALARDPNRDNVLLEWVGVPRETPRRLLAIDFTHAFTGGRDLTGKIRTIEAVQDEGVYGLFPEFVPFIRPDVAAAAAEKLRAVDPQVVTRIISAIPAEWQVDTEARQALGALISDRARWLADRIPSLLAQAVERLGGDQPLLPWSQGGSG